MKAIGLNRCGDATHPYIPGMDISGTIDQIGIEVDPREAVAAHRKRDEGGLRGRIVLDFEHSGL